MCKKSACKDCEKRYIGCHATCEDYLSFKKEREEILAKMHEETSYKSLIHDMSTLKRRMDRHRKEDKIYGH